MFRNNVFVYTYKCQELMLKVITINMSLKIYYYLQQPTYSRYKKNWSPKKYCNIYNICIVMNIQVLILRSILLGYRCIYKHQC